MKGHNRAVDLIDLMKLEFQALTWDTREQRTVVESHSNADRVRSSSYLVTAFGRTAEGRSVRLTVLDHRPSFYVVTTDEEAVRHALSDGTYTNRVSGGDTESISYEAWWLVRLEVVQRHLLDYFRNGERTGMLKVTCANVDRLRQMRTALSDAGFVLGDGKGFNALHSFFHKVRFTDANGAQHGIQPCGWLGVQYGEWDDVCIHEQRGLSPCFCDIDLVVKDEQLQPLPERQMIAPFHIMSFDIEQNGIPRSQESRDLGDVALDLGEEDEEKFSFPDSALPECEISTICLRAWRHGQEGMSMHCFTYKAVDEEQIRNAVHITSKDVEGGEWEHVELQRGEILVHQGRDEKDMLKKFVSHMRLAQYDVDQSWNGITFDWQAIYKRCKRHEISLREVGKVQHWREPELRLEQCSTQSRGNSSIEMFDIPGMVHHDLIRIWREDHKETSYGLEAVSSKHLGEHKIPMDPNHITAWAKQPGVEGLTRVVIYCIQDTALPERLGKKYRKFLNLIMFCNEAQILPNEYIQRGSNVRTMSAASSRMERLGYVRDNAPKLFNPPPEMFKYQGAEVLTPLTGLHRDPIATLDYAGLYPANINSNYIDYMRFVEIGGAYDNLDGVRYKEFKWTDVTEREGPDGKKTMHREEVHFKFVVGEGYPSLMPTWMEELRKKRKVAKKEVVKYKQRANDDPANREEHLLLADIWDARQLAIKLMMNAGYGFLGTAVSPMPHRPLAMCITYFGRFMLEQAQRYVLARYGEFDDVETAPEERTGDQIHKIAQGRSVDRLRRDAKGIEIVYGDTDSIMCKWKPPTELRQKLDAMHTLASEEQEAIQNEVLHWVSTVATAAEEGASEYLNLHFCEDTQVVDGKLVKAGAQKLEFEKIFWPAHFYRKKRYMFRKFAPFGKVCDGYVAAQGMAMVRRDISRMSAKLLWDCANAYMKTEYCTLQAHVEKAFGTLVEMAKCIGDPRQLDLEQLEVTKQLARSYDESKVFPSHKVVAEKLKARGENPQAGDRVGYVQIIDFSTNKKSQAVDSIKYIRKQGLAVDIKQIADDLLDVLLQVIPPSTDVNVEEIVLPLMRSIKGHQAQYDAKAKQRVMGNRGLDACGFTFDSSEKRGSTSSASSSKRHAQKRKRSASGDASILSFLK